MDFYEQEKGKAHELLREVKKKEQKLSLIPIRVAHNTTIMMSSNATKKEIEAKIKQYQK